MKQKTMQKCLILILKVYQINLIKIDLIYFAKKMGKSQNLLQHLILIMKLSHCFIQIRF